MTNAEARFNNSLRPRKPEGSLGRTAQDGHLDSHTAPELSSAGVGYLPAFNQKLISILHLTFFPRLTVLCSLKKGLTHTIRMLCFVIVNSGIFVKQKLNTFHVFESRVIMQYLSCV